MRRADEPAARSSAERAAILNSCDGGARPADESRAPDVSGATSRDGTANARTKLGCSLIESYNGLQEHGGDGWQSRGPMGRGRRQQRGHSCTAISLSAESPTHRSHG